MMSMTDVNFRRSARPVTLKRSRPNLIFQEWLEELLEEAKQKRCKLEYQLTEALTSLSKYPLQLTSGAECRILKGFDSTLCNFIDQRIKSQNQKCNATSNENSNNPISETIVVQGLTSTIQQVANNVIDIPEPDVLSRLRHKNYMTKLPCYSQVQGLTSSVQHLANSVIDISEPDVLSRLRHKNYITKLICYSSILTALQELSKDKDVSIDVLLTHALKEVHLTMKRLLACQIYLADRHGTFLPIKEFVCIKPDTKCCFLTTRGLLELHSLNKLLNERKDLISKSTQTDDVQTIGTFESYDLTDSEVTTIEMSVGTYDIILLIDKNETSGSTNKNDPTVAQFKKYVELKHEYRSLKVGDFAWIARHKVNESQELVLPYIVERKRLDDLSASIKDGRFHEQKFRLRRCGLDNVIYMVESYTSKKHVGLPVQTLMQALANTRAQDGFKVHMTDSLSNSARFLAMMTKRLTIEYRGKTLKGRNAEPNGNYLMTFDYFNKMSVKNKPLTVTETFIKMLLQLKGLSVEKALAITKVYSTPKSLIHAYEYLSKEDGEMLLENLKYGELSRKVGPVVSKSMYQLFSSYDIR